MWAVYVQPFDFYLLSQCFQVIGLDTVSTRWAAETFISILFLNSYRCVDTIYYPGCMSSLCLRWFSPGSLIDRFPSGPARSWRSVRASSSLPLQGRKINGYYCLSVWCLTHDFMDLRASLTLPSFCVMHG